jgi:hypothetical protein
VPSKKTLKVKATKKKPAAKKKTAPKESKKAAAGKAVVKKRKIKFSVSRKVVRSRAKKIIVSAVEPVILSSEIIQHVASAVPHPVPPSHEPFSFPHSYGDNKIVLMVRDPYWLFTYWELREKERTQAQEKAGSGACECLRLYKNDAVCFDIEIGGMANNWYVNVPEAGASYWLEIGFRSADGRFFAAARSNVVKTPLDRMSDVIDEEWMIPDWDALYALSGGFGFGHSSAGGWGFALFSPTSPTRARA